MFMKNKNVEKELQQFLDRQFAGVQETQQLFEIKEELRVNLRERISDMMKQGKTEKEAFKEAVISMGDLSGLVEEMRAYGQDKVKQSINTTSAARLSAVGVISGVLILLFGILTSLMVYFMGKDELMSLSIACMFTIIGVGFITYGTLTRESAKRYAMNKVRALLYVSAIGSIVFALFVTGIAYFATEELFIAIATSMIFLLTGVGMLMILLFTGKSRVKNTV